MQFSTWGGFSLVKGGFPIGGPFKKASYDPAFAPSQLDEVPSCPKDVRLRQITAHLNPVSASYLDDAAVVYRVQYYVAQNMAQQILQERWTGVLPSALSVWTAVSSLKLHLISDMLLFPRSR